MKKLIFLLVIWLASTAVYAQSNEGYWEPDARAPDLSITVDFSFPVYGLNKSIKQEMGAQGFSDTYTSWFGTTTMPHSRFTPTLGVDVYRQFFAKSGLGIRGSFQTGYVSGFDSETGRIAFDYQLFRLTPYYRLLAFRQSMLDVGISANRVRFEVIQNWDYANPDQQAWLRPGLMASFKTTIVQGEHALLRFFIDGNLILGPLRFGDYDWLPRDAPDNIPEFTAFDCRASELAVGLSLGWGW